MWESIRIKMFFRPSSFFLTIITILTVVAVMFIYEFKYMKQALDAQFSSKEKKTNVSVSRSSQGPEIQVPVTSKSFHSSQLYTFGGEKNDSRYLSSASKFNSSTGKWQSINSLPTARVQYCGAVVNNKIYLFGGFAGNRTNPMKLNETIVYDISNDTYKILQPMPDTRESCGAAVLNGYVFVAGGSHGLNSFRHLSSVIRYNIQTDQWSNVRSMNTPRRGLQLLELNEQLYAIGGEDLRTVEVYDSFADRWSLVASMQTQHNHFGAAVHDGKIYAIDWYGFEVYSPETDRWTTLTKPGNYDYHTLVSMTSKLWTFGEGYNVGDKPKVLKTVYSYDTYTQKWTKQQDMDVARTFHSAFVVN